MQTDNIQMLSICFWFVHNYDTSGVSAVICNALVTLLSSANYEPFLFDMFGHAHGGKTMVGGYL